jgi:hypothetical protein
MHLDRKSTFSDRETMFYKFLILTLFLEPCLILKKKNVPQCKTFMYLGMLYFNAYLYHMEKK